MNEILKFDYRGKEVRSFLDIEGEPWFVAADVCRILEIDNVSHATSRLDDDERGIISNDTLGGTQMVIVSEPGLYSLIFGSRKPEARAFTRWVTHEVLPAIRKTGSYSMATAPTVPALTTDPLMVAMKLLVQSYGETLAIKARQEETERRVSVVEGLAVEALASSKATADTITNNIGYVTVLGYARTNGIDAPPTVLQRIGKLAKKECLSLGLAPSTIGDARWGTVGMYPVHVLDRLRDHFL